MRRNDPRGPKVVPKGKVEQASGLRIPPLLIPLMTQVQSMIYRYDTYADTVDDNSKVIRHCARIKYKRTNTARCHPRRRDGSSARGRIDTTAVPGQPPVDPDKPVCPMVLTHQWHVDTRSHSLSARSISLLDARHTPHTT